MAFGSSGTSEEEADFADKDPTGRYIRVRFPNLINYFEQLL